MKYFFVFFLLIISLPCLGQQITYDQFQSDAKSQINLQPEYGHKQKTKEEITVDNDFIALCLKNDTTHRKASDHLVRLGFTHLYQGDIEPAMRRFNQAWMLDSTNENSYWGFGAIYGSFNDYKLALDQYNKGLTANPNSSVLLTDKATIYMMTFQKGGTIDNLKTAIDLFQKSYAIDVNNQNTLYKLSICYFFNNDCISAMKYYNECKKLGGTPISPDYAKALIDKCSK
jgi:tetratricopeptide (TPR) repeat protein